jgi:glutaminase
MDSPLQDTLARLHARFSTLFRGEVATYIPELGRADPAAFAICCATVDGHLYAAGDADAPFTIQSISKPFVYGLALEDFGVDEVAAKVGLEPSGEAFNAISLEPGTGRPRNPMINAGAIATASLVAGSSSDEKMARTVDMLSAFAGRRLTIDDAVYRSERDTGHRNRAISYLLRNAAIVGDEVDAVLDRYFLQCSVLVNTADLAAMAATLAAGGRNPCTNEQVIGFEHVQRVLSVMSTCGMYDYAGSWLYRVGMPAKSGVSGGVMAVLPGQLGIGVYSPLLDEFGNSVRGVAVCEALSEEFGLHLLRPPLQPNAVVMRGHTLAEAGSKRRRTGDEIGALAARGDEAHIFRLQGPLAFSTAEVALRRASEAYAPGNTLVFDCTRVDSTDAAANRLFQALTNVVQASGGTVVLAGLRETQAWQAASASEGGSGPLFFPDIDAALEWCENRILEDVALVRTRVDELPLDCHPLLRELTERERASLIDVATRVSYDDRETVVRQGEPADAIYFIVAGSASVQLNLPSERRHRLATIGPGTTFGELALLDDQPRTADVEADGDLTCWVLRIEDLMLLEQTASGVRPKLMEQLARDLAARLRRADLEIMTLAS